MNNILKINERFTYIILTGIDNYSNQQIEIFAASIELPVQLIAIKNTKDNNIYTKYIDGNIKDILSSNILSKDSIILKTNIESYDEAGTKWDNSICLHYTLDIAMKWDKFCDNKGDGIVEIKTFKLCNENMILFQFD